MTVICTDHTFGAVAALLAIVIDVAFYVEFFLNICLFNIVFFFPISRHAGVLIVCSFQISHHYQCCPSVQFDCCHLGNVAPVIAGFMSPG